MATQLEAIPEETQTPASPEPTPVRVTAEAPKTKPAKEKNPGRVESGKSLAERNRLAREAKKKATSDAASGKTSSAPSSSTSSTTSETSDSKNSIYVILGVGGLLVSAAGVYYQREAIQQRFAPKPTPPAAPANESADTLAAAPSRIPVQKGIRKME